MQRVWLPGTGQNRVVGVGSLKHDLPHGLRVMAPAWNGDEIALDLPDVEPAARLLPSLTRGCLRKVLAVTNLRERFLWCSQSGWDTSVQIADPYDGISKP